MNFTKDNEEYEEEGQHSNQSRKNNLVDDHEDSTTALENIRSNMIILIQLVSSICHFVFSSDHVN